jgi:hypothetical protein
LFRRIFRPLEWIIPRLRSTRIWFTRCRLALTRAAKSLCVKGSVNGPESPLGARSFKTFLTRIGSVSWVKSSRCSQRRPTRPAKYLAVASATEGSFLVEQLHQDSHPVLRRRACHKENPQLNSHDRLDASSHVAFHTLTDLRCRWSRTSVSCRRTSSMVITCAHGR